MEVNVYIKLAQAQTHNDEEIGNTLKDKAKWPNLITSNINILEIGKDEVILDRNFFDLVKIDPPYLTFINIRIFGFL